MKALRPSRLMTPHLQYLSCDLKCDKIWKNHPPPPILHGHSNCILHRQYQLRYECQLHQYCSAKPKGGIFLLVKWADTAFWHCTRAYSNVYNIGMSWLVSLDWHFKQPNWVGRWCYIQPDNAEICLYKPPKGFFQFEIIINVLVRSFRFIWIPVLWVYGHYKCCTLLARGSTLDIRIWRLQTSYSDV